MTDPDPGSVSWGEKVIRRASGIRFLCYEPRRRHVVELLSDMVRWSDRVHAVQGERRITFGQLLTAIPSLAGELRSSGLEPGDRVLLLAPNSPEWVVSFWAVLWAGGIVVLGNGWWSELEAAHAVATVQPRLALTDAKRRPLLSGSLATDQLLDIGGAWRHVSEARSGAEPALDPEREDDAAVIIFTAGTTGAAKAVTLAHRSVIANLHNLLLVSRRLPHQLREDRPPEVILQSGPLFHIGGIQSLLLALLAGNTVVFLQGRFDAGQVLDLIEREKVTVWGAVPTMVSRVLEHPSLPGRDLSPIRSISLGGTPVHPTLMERLREAFPGAKRGVSTIYGLTETGGTLTSASGELMARHPTTAGRPLPVVELRIDGPGAVGIGEIVARTPSQMLGYWGEERPDIIEEDGWLHTGDLGRLQGDLLFVTGRLKDVIIRGGENVAAAHVESVLHRHPAVATAAVIGIPDQDLGERVAAIVQLREGHGVSESELAAFARRELAHFEVPDCWWLRREEIPMTEAGKADKRRLREAWLVSRGGGDGRPT